MGEASTTIVTAGGAKKPNHELRIICGMAGIRGGWCASATSTPLLTPRARQRRVACVAVPAWAVLRSSA